MLRKLLALLLVPLCLLAGCGGDTPAEPTSAPTVSVEVDPVPKNEYDAEAFAVADGFLTYTGGFSAVGVDVSSHQKEIDWAAVAEAGVEFAMIRAGYRGYTEGGLFEDEYFRANLEGAAAAGLDVGVYFFSQAVSREEAREEAEFLLSLLDGYALTYPVVFDWERQSGETSRTRLTDGDTVTRCAVDFCEVVEAAGYLPMVYFSPSKGYGELDLETLMEWPFWLAHYTDGWQPTSFRYHFHVWQYSSTGSVPGIKGNVDLNLCLTEFTAREE